MPAVAALPVQPSRIFIVENLATGLAFSDIPGAVVFMARGYAVDILDRIPWLRDLPTAYWGDIDTWGLAMLASARRHLPQLHALLMDRATLLAHTAHWGEEPQPLLRNLPWLTAEEGALFDDLRDNRLQTRLRLEQERVGFGWVQRALMGLKIPGGC